MMQRIGERVGKARHALVFCLAVLATGLVAFGHPPTSLVIVAGPVLAIWALVQRRARVALSLEAAELDIQARRDQVAYDRERLEIRSEQDRVVVCELRRRLTAMPANELIELLDRSLPALYSQRVMLVRHPVKERQALKPADTSAVNQ